MNSLNTLGIRIVGVTAVVAIVLFGVWKGISYSISQYQSLRPVPTATITPSLPAEISPVPTLAPELQQELSQYIQKTNTSLGPYTKKYIDSLPNNIEKQGVLDTKLLEKFVEEHKGELLPKLTAGTVKTTSKKGKAAIQAYLDSISPLHNKAIQPVTGDTITSALQKQQTNEDLEAMAPVRASIEKNFSLFSAVAVPGEAIELHTKLLQATLALLNNVKLLQEMRNDVVGGLIGQKNISELNAVFSDISSQIQQLEKKYNIK